MNLKSIKKIITSLIIAWAFLFAINGYAGSSDMPSGANAVSYGTVKVRSNLFRATYLVSGPVSYSGSGFRMLRIGAPAGDYTIIYGDVPGYVTPASETKTLSSGATITFTGDYKRNTGTVEVRTNLFRATFLVSGPKSYPGKRKNWRQRKAPEGDYTIIYGDVPGFVTPISETKTLTAGGIITFTGDYRNSNGTVEVKTNLFRATFLISGPVSYSGTGKNWRRSGAPAGDYTITYGNVPGFITPASETQTLAPGATITFAGPYYENTPSLTAALPTESAAEPKTTSASGDTLSYSVSLSQGWNLISLPLQPVDTSIEEITSSINDACTRIWTSSDGEELIYYPDNPEPGTLVTMEAGVGYWINMAEGGSLLVEGAPSSSSIALKKGLNLAGYNSTVSKPAAEALHSISGKYSQVWTIADGKLLSYDPDNLQENSLKEMEPGRGYLIEAIEDCVWDVQ